MMKMEKVVKESFVVIGKEGSTSDGDGFIQRLWLETNTHFGEIAHLVKKDENGNLVGIWGAMSDITHSFMPWADFKDGLYLAGVECIDDAQAPVGWVKWIVPAYEYICVENDAEDAFAQTLRYMNERNIALVGAVHDFTCPRTGKNYLFFPIREL
jgi:hypothetical protein